MTKLDKTKSILADLIAFPTISNDSNIEMIQYCAEYLRKLGAKVETILDHSGEKANLFATLGAEKDGGIILSGHSDVVPTKDQIWTTEPFRMVEKEGKLFGRGACDMKGFIAAVLAMAQDYAKLPLRRPVHFAFTHDEECGCLGAQHLISRIKELPYKPAMAIIGEPTEMKVINGHKAIGLYTTTFKGLAGHGSAPDLGVNAVEFAARYAVKLSALRDDLKTRAPSNVAGEKQFDPPWTTINIGKIEGGVAHNVIPSSASVKWEMRPVIPTDRDFINSEISKFARTVLLPEMKSIYPDADISVTVDGEIMGLTPISESEARRLVLELTGAKTSDLVAFGTEAGIFQSIGIDAIVCGPGSIREAHKADEFVTLEEIKKCLKFLESLKTKLV